VTALLDPERIIRTLNGRDVRYVLIGGMAGNLRGTPDVTNDMDICCERSQPNLERLALALRDLSARLRVAREDTPLEFPIDARSLRLGDTFTFTTEAGDLDVLGAPSGTDGYPDVAAGATTFSIGGELTVDVASVEDLMRMKRAAGRTKDRLHLEHLAALREEIDEVRRDGGDPQQGT
jgi:hypothetical protein